MRKKHFLIAAIILIGLLLAKPVFNFVHHPYIPQILGDAVWCVDIGEKVIALTIDDGPSTVYTPQILDLLDRYNARATFFVVGMNVEEHADLIVAMYTSGNEIGNHSWDHPRLTFRSMSFIREQIQRNDQAIRSTGYEGEIPFRAPYGAKLITLPYILDQMNRENVLWNVDTTNWHEPGAAQSSGNLEVELSAGDIILFHISGKEDALAWMELILEEYTTKGYRFVTISELLAYQHSEYPSSFQCVKDGNPGNLFSARRTGH